MKKCIEFLKVNLHYSALAFRETSFKSYIFKLVAHKQYIPRSDIHALKNVDIAISPGERIALIGQNGAGKSTLLKTIAGLYPISSGKRYVQGQIRALFDLGLGFESEATGKENIMYRGLMLGKTPKEMRILEKSIIDFCDIGKFIDYPIKTYSSGMMVRLAFSISTMISGDILLLDEILGAGDAAFMQRAKQRINELIADAEILVLATHDVSAIRQLCQRALVLHQGEIIFDGNVEEAMLAYNNKMLV